MTDIENDLLGIIQKNMTDVTVSHLRDYISNTEKLKKRVHTLEKKNEELTEVIFEQETEIEKLRGLGLLDEDLNRRSEKLDEIANKLEVTQLQLKLDEANKRADAIESLTRRVMVHNDKE